ncbi:MAG: biotin--[acetyl-CoA-carboxylase] ligase [Candidatus Zixiibacteriota bacterium]
MPIRTKEIEVERKAVASSSPADRFSLPDDLLLQLRKSGKPIAVAALARKYKIDSATVEQVIDSIASWGYKLKRTKENVQFVDAPDILSATEIGYGLKTKLIGMQIHSYRSLKSTNDLAADLAEHGAPEGTVVTSEEQTKGRGRLGRIWHSVAHNGIYVSIVLRPEIRPDQAPGISIMTSLALLEAFASFTKKPLAIKWPNDLLLSGKKVAGILTELNADRGKINHVIVGVGINVNHNRDDFPDTLIDTATSLRLANGEAANRVELLKEFLRRFEKQYAKYLKSGLKSVHGSLKKHSSLLGNEVTIRSGDSSQSGKAVDITANGELVLSQNGVRIVIAAGEVTVAKS